MKTFYPLLYFFNKDVYQESVFQLFTTLTKIDTLQI